MKICLTMIVKNESKIISRLIDSVLPIIDSWCIVDTGSTDNTIEIVKSKLSHLPGEIVSSPWVNFGHNRSQVVELSRKWGDWSLTLDADMILVDNGFNKSELDSAVAGYYLFQKSPSISYSNMRFLNTKFTWKSIGVTHEYYSVAEPNSDLKTIYSLEINDIGDGGAKADKFERDIRLLVDDLKVDPNNSRSHFYLAESYYNTQQFALARKYYRSCVDLTTWDQERFFAKYKIGLSSIALVESDEVISADLMLAWLDRPLRAEPIFRLAQYFKSKNWEKAYALLKLCVSIPYPHGEALFVFPDNYGAHPLDELSLAAWYTGRFHEFESCILSLKAYPEYYEKHKDRLENNLSYLKK